MYHEHVTNFIYENDDFFKLKFIEIPKVLHHKKDYRFTLDTIKDFITLQKIYSDITEKKLNLQNLVQYVENHNELKQNMANQIKLNIK